jgi:hypothetical protein
VAILRDVRPIDRRDAMFLLQYTLGIAIELTVAFWLLSVASGEYAWAAWIAYLILISAALATVIGLAWCWLLFAGRGLGWYLAAVLSVVGAWLLISGTKLISDAISYLGHLAH